jgi:alginate O-acetyltransferase complex protein AlgI
MLFNSAEFLLFFLPATLAGFLLVAARSCRTATFWLSVASIAFYAYWDVTNLPILIISVVFNWCVGRIVGQYQGRSAGRYILGIAISIDLFMLGYFKYAQFTVDAINQFGVDG